MNKHLLPPDRYSAKPFRPDDRLLMKDLAQVTDVHGDRYLVSRGQLLHSADLQLTIFDNTGRRLIDKPVLDWNSSWTVCRSNIEEAVTADTNLVIELPWKQAA